VVVVPIGSPGLITKDGCVRVSRLAVAVVLASLTAACGSTVQVTGTASVGDGLSATTGDGLSATTGGATGGASTGATGQLPVVPAGGATGGTVGPGTSGTTGISGTTGGSTGGTTGAVAGAVPEKGRGWDAKNVYFGIVTQKDAQTAFESVGVNGLNAGDQEAQAKAVVDEINRQGGILGRQAKLIFHDVSTIGAAQDPSGTGQTSCTFFTQDHPVIAVFSPVTLQDVPSFRGCMNKAKTPIYSLTVNGIDSQVLRELQPYYYAGLAPAWDRLAPVLVTQLKQMGYFTGWNPQVGAAGPNPVKTGVLVPDDTVGRRIADHLVKALSAAGQKGTVVYKYDPANVATAMGPAVVNLAGNGVTHVMTINADQLPFELSASSQGYRPRYGLTSYAAMQAELESNGPAGQNVGAMGVGWSPSVDVSDANDPGPSGPGEVQCLQIQKRAGQTFGGKRLAEALAFGLCDGLQLFAKAAQLGNGFTGQALYAGVLKALPTFHPAISFGNGLSANSLSVPGGVRRIAWVTACNCFRYQGSTNYPIS
jgi:ABC-type branched-subunit amino acid transport system substrate-binding protein